MQALEILAPAGGQEQLFAAVRCGADAVYLGAKGFNARQNAENFAQASLSQAVSYCHARNVRVYVTLNTLVTDDELPALYETLREIAQSGADAVIVQDLSVARLVSDRCPGVELHASTQMTIHNASGARLLESLGFSRVVLSRELTIAEIRAIAQSTSLSLEVFVHGALCMSASGACYLSSMLGGRSGNRGLCAQPCRLDFRAGERAYALSLKDLSALSHVEALRGAGVSSLKIEGRMKRPEYVAAAVTACRAAVAGEAYDLKTLEAAFSRGGFTDGYLTGRRDLSMFGVRSEADKQASQQAYGALSALYQREAPRVAVDMALALSPGAPAALQITDGRHSLRKTGPIPEPAAAAPIDHDRAWRSLSKTGDTPFFLRSLNVANDGGLMLPASALNALRREALDALLSLREAPAPKPLADLPFKRCEPHVPPAETALRVRVQTASQLWDGLDADLVALPLGEITPALIARYGERLAAEVPALLFPGEEARALEALAAHKAEGLSRAVAENWGAVWLIREAGLVALGGAGLNLLSSDALQEAARLGVQDATVSFELPAQKLRRLLGQTRRGAIAYGYLPLMRLRCCPAQGPNGCGACDGRPSLTDRLGVSFPLLCHQKHDVTLLNSIPLNLSGEPLPGADFLTLYFTLESRDACRRVYEAFRAGEAPTGPRTRGLYYRTLQ